MTSNMDHERYKKAFVANHSRLVRKLTAPELVGACFTKGLLTLSEKEELESFKTDTKQINKLLVIFHRRYFSDREIFSKLYDILKEINDEEGGYIDHVIFALKETLKNPPDFPTSQDLLSEEDRARLRLNESTILTTLDVLQILPDLISEGVISFKESDVIENGIDFSDRGQKFLEILSRRGSDSYHRFIGILRETEVYEQLAQRLMGGQEDSDQPMDDEKYVEGILRDGHIPPPPQNYIKRQDLLKAIRKQLRKLKHQDSWVLVSGLPGYGKTVLAAESVRNAPLLREVFMGGVYWLNVGRMTNNMGEIDTAALLEKVQNFIVRMDKDKHRPNNLESATDYLQTVMTEQHPQSLLILDDVWEPETAQVFAVRCRTLVTSRNAEVANGIQTNNIYKVTVMEGFTTEEGKELLSKWTTIPVPQLPPTAAEIIRLCHGSPIALDIIGAMLQRNTTPARWEAVAERLRKQHAGSLVLPRERAGSTPELGGRRFSDHRRGRTKETVNTSILLTEESLPVDIQEHFHYLVVFEPDTVIPTGVLATLWDENEFAAEDIMLNIVGWSLAQQAWKKSQQDGYLSFTIHDMILDYLKDTVKSGRQIQYHQELVERYQEKCGGNFADLQPDGYIHQRLLSHLFSANMFDLLAQLLSDLNWLAVCSLNWDPNSLLGAYKKYRYVIPDQFISAVNELQLFLSGHLDVLAGHGLTVQDVIQLALNTLSSEELLKQAKEAAKKDKKTMWLTWCNQSSINRPTALLHLKPHKNEVKYCQYFDQGSKVISCSAYQTKIWEASTGKIFETFGGHDNQITHCVISEDGKLLVTCSEDTTCKVWTIPKKLILTFKEHVDGIQWCDLSPDTKLVVSVDIGSAVKVWYAHTGEVHSEWDHGDTGLTSCAFIPQGDALVVASQDGIIKLYSLSGLCMCTFPVTAALHSPTGGFDLSWSRGPSRTSSSGSGSGSTFTIRSCVFSKDGSLMAAGVGDCSAKVWSVKSGQCLHSFRHSSDVLCVDFSPDAKLLVSGCVSGMVKVWSLTEERPVLDLPLHYDWVICVKFSPQGTHILSSSYLNGSIKIIQNQSNQKSWKLYRRRFAVNFSLNKEGEGYIPTMVCYDMVQQKLEICQGLDATPVKTLATVPNQKPRSWDLSPDGKLVVLGYDIGTLQLLEVPTEKEVWLKETAHERHILHCFFSPDGNKVVSCGETDRCHKVWNIADGTMLSWQHNCRDFWIKPCVFYNDSIRLASTTPGKVLVWCTNSGKELFNCEGISDDPNESILCVNISGDNTKLIASASTGRIAVWNAESGVKLFSGSHNNVPARFCSLNWNGSIAAVGHDDCSLKIYNTETKVEISPTSHHHSGVWMINTQFSPDERQIVTLSDSIQWWTTNGVLLKQFLLKSTFGKYIYFSPDFKTFVTIDNTGLLYVLQVLEV